MYADGLCDACRKKINRGETYRFKDVKKKGIMIRRMYHPSCYTGTTQQEDVRDD